jgi:hypothetical protein
MWPTVPRVHHSVGTGSLGDRWWNAPCGHGPLGRSERQTEHPGPRPVARTTTTAVHLPVVGGGARRAFNGRTLFGPGPHRHPTDRGNDFGFQNPILHRHRHPQHATGRPGVGNDRLFSCWENSWNSAPPAGFSPVPKTRAQNNTSQADSVNLLLLGGIRPRGTDEGTAFSNSGRNTWNDTSMRIYGS